MSKRFAVIGSTSSVLDVVEIEDDEQIFAMPGFKNIEVTELPDPVAIGWNYDGQTFTAPE